MAKKKKKTQAKPTPSKPKPASKETNQHSSNLTWWILGSIVLAIAVALIFPTFAMKFHVGGELFLRLLKMIVVPLVITSVLCGILGMGDVRKLGKPGAAAIGYYICTTILAVAVGLVVVNVIRPGSAVSKESLEKIKEEHEKSGAKDNPTKEKVLGKLAEVTGLSKGEVEAVFEKLPAKEPERPSLMTIFQNLALMLVTDNLFVSAANTNLLPLIVFSIIFGALLTTMGKGVDSITTIIEQLNEALMNFVLLLMKIAPIGIFCLVASRFGEAQSKGEFLQELTQIGWYFLTVVVGLGIHALLILPLIFWIIRRENPYRFMGRMSQAILTAFSTASSSATLPVTMECAEKNAGVNKKATEFVLPLGATINMDGTALYEAAAAIFIAQAIGYDLSFSEQLVIAVTATLAAIGAAGIPEAGLVTMLIVLNAAKLPVEYVGLILSVDWLLDRFRTAVNTFGDSIGAAVVETVMPDHGR